MRFRPGLPPDNKECMFRRNSFPRKGTIFHVLVEFLMLGASRQKIMDFRKLRTRRALFAISWWISGIGPHWRRRAVNAGSIRAQSAEDRRRTQKNAEETRRTQKNAEGPRRTPKNPEEPRDDARPSRARIGAAAPSMRALIAPRGAIS